MPRYVALFRGINVGRAKRIAMADLKILLTKLGYSDVRTLLNSGNAVFTAKAAPVKAMAARIRSSVAAQLKVDALVVVKAERDMTAILADNALARVASDPSRLLIAVAQDPREIVRLKARLKTIASADWGNERVHLGRQAAYLWCANGILASRAAEVLLKELADTGTTRNWGTVQKIHALMTT